MGWLIDIAVEESTGKSLKKRMNVEDIPSSEEMSSETSSEDNTGPKEENSDDNNRPDDIVN